MYTGIKRMECESIKHILVIYSNIILMFLITGIAISTDTPLLMFCFIIPILVIYFYNKKHRCITE